MRKSIYLSALAGVLLFTAACSDNNSNEPPAAAETASIEFTISFEEAAKSGIRAAGSTAIPTTSWSNINEVQFFVYDVAAPNTVKYSIVKTPTELGNDKKLVVTDVPVGTYKVVAVANAQSSSTNRITSYMSGTATVWNGFNVRQKNLDAFDLRHESRGSFPAYANPNIAGVTNNVAYYEPAEIFMGTSGVVTVTTGAPNATGDISLKREVSLLRARLNVADAESGVNNSSGANGVNWASNVSILIHNLPEKMTLAEGNAGGFNGTSKLNDILVRDGALKTMNPTTGYGPGTILLGNFKMWQDIIVFPNVKRNIAVSNIANADPGNRYFIVVSALGLTGHVLADGTALTADETIYWSGQIHPAFFANTIREVNMTLKSGGSTEIPVDPVQEGGLEITLSDPEAWNSVILDVTMDI